ncbi:hypothetical protein A3H22_04465 [Candidatus Peribacteria bacterium RIFCSPLOWO2_12_FULL_55_15]|nr:MAG: hypothetical protein A2789_01880 [Candidatus Peribacteria bacterium RIFCSPHIGHO2_01_FULL_54_22]OGJ62315.1 MAG: hypothetical protein A3D12_02140 [Candidatus Peribacteria bacterium RIFCSPHIGHO2_02_FULL_55_24]OGJ64920.1 MAG: hypothetical protein A3E47_03405 [Candidatus Peribacteria bacterium RIFCSPHIGHO2_12_FULL_54_10]OGJ67730.1 MAG: hypothetical protein A2947_03375 [Candidatus Peribacteria bacterium RIFCSPLOWO2_01_FULL_54_110]OGJ68896.1 MAG: hypothetical protein A3H90_01975 [Candidatus Pe
MELIRRDPEERLQFLSHIQPLLMRLPAPEMLPKIARWDFDGRLWECTATEEVPALKQLMG